MESLAGARFWVAVKERNLSCHTPQTILYISVMIMVALTKFLSSNPGVGGPSKRGDCLG